jgi:hypothetical protein
VDRRLEPLRVPLTTKAESSLPCHDTENFVCGRMIMGCAIHGIYPLGHHFPYCFQATLKLSGCGVKGAMVYHEWF